MPRAKDRKVRHDLMRGQEAATLIGVSRPTVLAMVARGEMRSKTVAGLLFVFREDAERIAKERKARAAAA